MNRKKSEHNLQLHRSLASSSLLLLSTFLFVLIFLCIRIWIPNTEKEKILFFCVNEQHCKSMALFLINIFISRFRIIYSLSLQHVHNNKNKKKRRNEEKHRFGCFKVLGCNCIYIMNLAHLRETNNNKYVRTGK